MAYEPHNWGCAEVITNSKLNHIEQGIADNANGKVFEVIGSGTCSNQSYYEFDISYADVMEIIANGAVAWNHQMSGDYALVICCKPYMEGSVYAVEVTYYNPSTLSLTTTTVYSDTEDGNLRTVNCWGLQ